MKARANLLIRHAELRSWAIDIVARGRRPRNPAERIEITSPELEKKSHAQAGDRHLVQLIGCNEFEQEICRRKAIAGAVNRHELLREVRRT